MPVPQITITPAGFAALANDEHTGTKVVKITHIGLTATHFDVNAVGAALPGEHKRLTTFGGKAVAADTLHLNIRDDGPDTYTMRGFGLYLQDGTLFAVYSQATAIMEKAAAATLLLATDIRFSKITATSIEVGDVDFINPPATTTQVGVVRFATDQEADAGSDQTTALTPRGLFRYINARFGTNAPSAFVKTLLNAATAAIFRTNLGIKSAALRDEGHGNGLNADLLDGSHGDYYLDWRNFTGLPATYPSAPHTHTTGQVVGLDGILAKKADLSGASFTGDVILGEALRFGSDGLGMFYRSALGVSVRVKDAGAGFKYWKFSGETGALEVLNGPVIVQGNVAWHAGNFTPADFAQVGRQVIAGNGMTGGGTLQADRSIALGQPSSVTGSSANSVSSTSHTHMLSLAYDAPAFDSASTEYPQNIVCAGSLPAGPDSGISTHLTCVTGGNARVAQIIFQPSGGSGQPTMMYRTSHVSAGGGGWTGLQKVWTDRTFNPDTKANLGSPEFTGTPRAPTASAGNNTTQLATTAFVQAAIAAALASYLPKNNPTFTGTMTGPSYNET